MICTCAGEDTHEEGCEMGEQLEAQAELFTPAFDELPVEQRHVVLQEVHELGLSCMHCCGMPQHSSCLKCKPIVTPPPPIPDATGVGLI